MLLKSELADELGCNVSDVEAWIAIGLPYDDDGRIQKFDPEIVFEWLVENDVAVDEPEPDQDPADLVGKTRSECAQFFDVDVSTVARWLVDPSFPGKAGDAGEQNGDFPFEKIAAWLDLKKKSRVNKNQHTGNDPTPSSREEYHRIQTERARFKFELERGQLLSAHEVKTEQLRINALAKQTLNPLPDMLVAILPADMPDEIKGEFRARAKQRLKTSFAILASLIRDDGQEAGQGDPGSEETGSVDANAGSGQEADRGDPGADDGGPDDLV